MALQNTTKRIIKNFYNDHRLLSQYLVVSTGVSGAVFMGNSFKNGYIGDRREYELYDDSLSVSFKFFPFINLIWLPCHLLYHIGEGFYYLGNQIGSDQDNSSDPDLSIKIGFGNTGDSKGGIVTIVPTKKVER